MVDLRIISCVLPMLALLNLAHSQEMATLEPEDLNDILFENTSLAEFGLPEFPLPLFNLSESGVVVPENRLVALIPLNVSSISSVKCESPTPRQLCACKPDESYMNESTGETFVQIKCEFFPNVAGEYVIYAVSGKGDSYAKLQLSLIEGEPPRFTVQKKFSSIPDWLRDLAISFAVILIASYVAYFIYKLATKKRDALNALYEQRTKTEDDMKVLRYRFFKREIDANTYNSLFKQKEQELALVNEAILKRLKPKKLLRTVEAMP
ncbi:MAG TPA: hypothetical protein VJI13_00535 [Candidatus Norongarragalinales archaeon]|nr:hypothetical protein [Candidatus Norongarragalinales archaeon]